MQISGLIIIIRMAIQEKGCHNSYLLDGLVIVYIKRDDDVENFVEFGAEEKYDLKG